MGEGAYGKVYHAYDKTTSKEYAVKILSDERMNQCNIKELEKEFIFLNNLDNPYILKAYDFKTNGKYVKDGNVSERVYIVLELIKNSEMFTYILETGCFNEPIARYFFQQIIEGLKYCSIKGIAHRDLKPENILFDEYFNVKICDFGAANLIAGKYGSGKMSDYCGTKQYAAPEILEQRSEYYGQQVDIFALGVILYVMVTRCAPFNAAYKNDAQYRLLVLLDNAQNYWH